MRLAGAIVFAGLAAGVITAPAQDSTAPLANSRQQLQTLKKDQAAEKSGANDQPLKGPTSSTEVINNLNLTTPLTGPERDKEKKSERKNWLVDGYDKLDPKSARSGRDREKPDEEQPLDPKDPDYFLRVYERQRATAEAKREQREKTSATETAENTRTADPFAPFLSTWLAGSPVKDALRDTLSTADRNDRTGESLRAATEHAVARDVTEANGNQLRTDLLVAPRSSADTAATNPFVQALGLNPGASESRTAASVPPPLPPPAPAAKPMEYSLPLPPRPAVMDAANKQPGENQKYFPQLKKF